MQKNGYPYYFQKADALEETRHRRHLRTRKNQKLQTTITNDFSHLSRIKLNKNKKHLLEEERNTQIDRSNRILYQKLAKCARRSEPSALKHTSIKHKKKPKVQTLPNSPLGSQHHKSRHRTSQQHQALTLFRGHDYIDEVEFKIKLVITGGMYYLIAQNEHTKIMVEMSEKQYWQLHYGQLQENPCHIFQYLQIEKGRVQFRTRQNEKQRMQKLGGGKQYRNIIHQKKMTSKRKDKSLELPKI